MEFVHNTKSACTAKNGSTVLRAARFNPVPPANDANPGKYPWYVLPCVSLDWPVCYELNDQVLSVSTSQGTPNRTWCLAIDTLSEMDVSQ